MVPSFGWDLAGYGESGSALCRADQIHDNITVTIFKAPFICRPCHMIDSSITETVAVEVEMLRRFSEIGNTYVDVPIDLQSLPSVVDHTQAKVVERYWQLVMRPVDYAFDALEPLGSNLGFAVARMSHLLGQLVTERGGLELGRNLFETYPAGSLQLICSASNWATAAYKGGEAEYRKGQWQGQATRKKRQAAQQKQAAKNAGLATLANCLGLTADEGFQIDDDEFDSALCALAGCLSDCAVSQNALDDILREKLAGRVDLAAANVTSPKGYVVIAHWPQHTRIRITRVDCLDPDHLFRAVGLCPGDGGRTCPS